MNKLLVLVAIIVSVTARPALGADWPQWRGPNRDGVWPEDDIVERFAQPQLPICWRAEIGSGYSGPTVANGLAYVTDRVASPTQLERVHCFNAFTGAKLWSRQYGCDYEQVAKRDGPRASVTIDHGRAFSLGTMGHLHCFSAVTGEILWKKDLKAEYRIKLPVWGIAAAPLIEKNQVIVHVGGEDGACLIAFDKAGGRPSLGKPRRRHVGPLGDRAHGPEQGQDMDVQRARRADNQRAVARGIRGDKPCKTDRAHQGPIGARRLLGSPGLCIQTRIRQKRQRNCLCRPFRP